jgi:hypothetical protein
MIIEALEMGGDWPRSIGARIRHECEIPTGRCRSIVLEIAGKYHGGRRNSKAYIAAHAKAEDEIYGAEAKRQVAISAYL